MRADVYLTAGGYAASRQQAKRLIEDGCVTVDGRVLRKASQDLDPGMHTVEVHDAMPYVGRGGLKLEAALDAFGLEVTGWQALDIGASTGGFTDCLLHRGAAHVWAVDAGSGQLADSLRKNSRVSSVEHCNARYLELRDIGTQVRLIVMDVSFISSAYLIPRFPSLLQVPGDAVCLIKPQFEVGRAMIGKGGIVRDARAHRFAVERVLEAGRQAGLTPVALIPSPIAGGDGNREFLVRMTYGQPDVAELTEKHIRAVTGC